ncbi:MAG: hypothetical protein AABZ55_14040 [Bdellovibrionota bacterium]
MKLLNFRRFFKLQVIATLAITMVSTIFQITIISNGWAEPLMIAPPQVAKQLEELNQHLSQLPKGETKAIAQLRKFILLLSYGQIPNTKKAFWAFKSEVLKAGMDWKVNRAFWYGAIKKTSRIGFRKGGLPGFAIALVGSAATQDLLRTRYEDPSVSSRLAKSEQLSHSNGPLKSQTTHSLSIIPAE